MGKLVLVTGGSRGIGRSTVKEFLGNGYVVMTTSTSGELDYDDDNLECFQLELSDRGSIKKLVRKFKQRGILIDVLINNAAIGGGEVRNPERIDIGRLREILEINLIGTIELTESLKDMIKQEGVIINVSSEFGSLSEDWGNVVPGYRISKAALNMFTRSVYKRFGEKGIRVYSFDPGWVKTDMGGKEAPRRPEEPAKEILKLSESNKLSGRFYRGLKERSW